MQMFRIIMSEKETELRLDTLLQAFSLSEPYTFWRMHEVNCAPVPYGGKLFKVSFDVIYFGFILQVGLKEGGI